MKLKTILLTGSLIVLGACGDSKYDLDKLVPEVYHKILYVNNSGKQSLTLYDTEDDNKYTFSVIKSGSDPYQAASVTVNVMTQAELDKEYSEPEGINYQLIDASCYSLDVTRLDFSPADRYKLVNISLKPQNVKAMMENTPDAVWVLPLQVSSETDSVNVDRCELFLRLEAVVSPAIGFTDSSSELEQKEYGSVSTFIEKIKFGLDVDNKWDLECQFAVDQDYVAEYNLNNGTFFRTLPERTYTVPETMPLIEGVTTAELEVAIKGEDLEPGDYMLPVRLTGISQFEVSEEKALYLLVFRIMGHKLERTGWTAEATSEELSGEGAVNGRAGCVLDDDLSTFWHSKWQNGEDKPPYELIIDAQKEYTFTQLAMVQRGNGYTDTGLCKYYVSSDKINWIEIGAFSMEEIADVQLFGIKSSKGRYIKIRIESSYRYGYCSLSEVYVYGLE